MAGKLEFSFNSSKLGEFPLNKEVMTIGRKEDNDIRIENLAVSGHHAKLLTIFEDSFLEDLSSTNGTFVNGKSIDKHPLKNGDVIVIGKHELRYINAAASMADDGEKTVLIRRRPEAEQAPVIMTRPNIEKAKLQILNGKSAGKELPLIKASVKLGKTGGEIVQINKRPDGHFIVYLDQSANKTSPLINGESIGSRAIKLHNHDVIEINRLKIEYYLSP
ncbi:MAG: pSer/pThr/pTyr-binding forkhead associated (FHA) protein [Pseudohongiellaceae bacterium]|jgi:pSer/pThr/pTyr-binding forkhead associated (FHA) protein